MGKDTIIAALGCAIGLAGMLLVFFGFVYAHEESFANVSSAKRVVKNRIGAVFP